jgi:hypothetical protein
VTQDIGGGGDHRLAAGGGSYPTRQVIGAAEVAGEQRNGKASLFVADNDGRIPVFVPERGAMVRTTIPVAMMQTISAYAGHTWQ